jgi:hypothetical protein
LLIGPVCLAGQALMHQPDLVVTSPGELGVLLQSLTAGLQAVAAGFAQAEKMEAAEAKTAEASTEGEQKINAALAEALRPLRDRAPVPDAGGIAP